MSGSKELRTYDGISTNSVQPYSCFFFCLFSFWLHQNDLTYKLTITTLIFFKKWLRLMPIIFAAPSSGNVSNSIRKPEACNFTKKRLWHSCFPVNFVKFLRTPFWIEHLWWLHATASHNQMDPSYI